MKKTSVGSALLGFRIPPELLVRVDLLAEQDHRSRSQMARLLMEEAVRIREQALTSKTASAANS